MPCSILEFDGDGFVVRIYLSERVQKTETFPRLEQKFEQRLVDLLTFWLERSPHVNDVKVGPGLLFWSSLRPGTSQSCGWIGSQSLICWTFEKVVLFDFAQDPAHQILISTLLRITYLWTIFFWRRLTIFFEANVWCHFFTECLTKSPQTQTAWAGDSRYALVHRLSATHASFAGNFNMVPGSHWDLGFNHFRTCWEV